MKRLPVIGVMGSGKAPHEDRAAVVGRWLAETGVYLLTGGGGGVMTAVSRAFYETPNRKGRVIGIIPGTVTPEGAYKASQGYPNPWVEIPIFTHLPLSGAQGTNALSRNHINILSCKAVIALPGSAGTASEVRLAHQYRRPVICYLAKETDIPGLPPGVRIETDFEQVKTFIRDVIEDSGDL